MQRIVAAVSEAAFRKLTLRKENDGFGEKSWDEWFEFISRDMASEDSVADRVSKNTRTSLLELWTVNFADNLAEIRVDATLTEAVPDRVKEAPPELAEFIGPKGSAVVVGRGPSLFRHNHLKLLAESGYRGVVMATDGALIECLKAGVVPTHVVSVDGNRELIVKWYDHPLVDEYGKEIKAFLSTTVAHNVYERVRKAGMEVYWFMPLFDDWRQNESLTKVQNLMSRSARNPRGTPQMNCLGHGGGSGWVLAWRLLRRSPVALIGIDLGYEEGTPLEQTSYYKSFIEAARGDVGLAATALKEIYNPDWGKKAMLDPVFTHYRETFREAALNGPKWLVTCNCTEGGTLWGENIVPMRFAEFLEKHRE